MSKNNKKENSKNYIPGLKISVAEVMAIQATFKSWNKLWKKEYKKSGLYSKDSVNKVFEDLFLKKKIFSRILKAKNTNEALARIVEIDYRALKKLLGNNVAARGIISTMFEEISKISEIDAKLKKISKEHKKLKKANQLDEATSSELSKKIRSLKKKKKKLNKEYADNLKAVVKTFDISKSIGDSVKDLLKNYSKKSKHNKVEDYFDDTFVTKKKKGKKANDLDRMAAEISYKMGRKDKKTKELLVDDYEDRYGSSEDFMQAYTSGIDETVANEKAMLKALSNLEAANRKLAADNAVYRKRLADISSAGYDNYRRPDMVYGGHASSCVCPDCKRKVKKLGEYSVDELAKAIADGDVDGDSVADAVLGLLNGDYVFDEEDGRYEDRPKSRIKPKPKKKLIRPKASRYDDDDDYDDEFDDDEDDEDEDDDDFDYDEDDESDYDNRPVVSHFDPDYWEKKYGPEEARGLDEDVNRRHQERLDELNRRAYGQSSFNDGEDQRPVKAKTDNDTGETEVTDTESKVYEPDFTGDPEMISLWDSRYTKMEDFAKNPYLTDEERKYRKFLFESIQPENKDKKMNPPEGFFEWFSDFKSKVDSRNMDDDEDYEDDIEGDIEVEDEETTEAKPEVVKTAEAPATNIVVSKRAQAKLKKRHGK